MLRADPDDGDDQRQAGGAEEREARGLSRSELAEPQERRRPAGHEQQSEEQRRERQAVGGEQAVDVEGHPGHDEVDGHEEPEADPLEPDAHDSPLGRVEHEPDEHPAANAPSTNSKPASAARNTSSASSRIDARTPTWPVVCSVSCRMRRSRGGRACIATHGRTGDEYAEADAAARTPSPRRTRS